MTTLNTFPAEILESIVKHLPLNDQLTFRQTSHHFNDFMRPRLPQLERPDHCEIEALKVHKLTRCIRLSTSSIDVSMALHFVDCTDFAVKTWKRKSEETGKIDCFLDFEFPPTRQFVLFNNARIGHVEISKHFPLHLEDENLQYLSTIFMGCTIDKFTVELDKKTVQNLDELPAFVSAHSVKHVEFSLQKTFIYDMVEPFLCVDDLAKSLVSAGVREITFSGDKMDGRKLDGIRNVVPVESGHHPRHGHSKPPFAFDVLRSFYRAGIQSITVNPNSLENEERAITRLERDAFFDKMVEACDKTLRLTLTLHNEIQGHDSSYHRCRKAKRRKVTLDWQTSSIPSPHRDHIHRCQHIVVHCTPMPRWPVTPINVDVTVQHPTALV